MKFCGQAVPASMTTLTGLDLGPLLSTPETAQLFRDGMIEAERLGRAEVPDLPDDMLEVNWTFISSLPPMMHASMPDDLRNGKPPENDWLRGEVVRLGRKHGIWTPIHRAFYAALKPIADRLEAGAR